jgi:hypothetical protein
MLAWGWAKEEILKKAPIAGSKYFFIVVSFDDFKELTLLKSYGN